MLRLEPLAAAALLLLAAPAAQALEGVVLWSDGTPVAHAEVSVLGRAGEARTDAEGRFFWTPAPVPPFEVLVLLSDGMVVSPIRVEALPEVGPLRLEIAPALQESVSVTAAAPGIDSTPASGTALLPARELAQRAPTSLAQSLENVAGVASLSEGQAAVPAIRGLSAGRTLLLIDGARVTAERRVGPSATYLAPETLEGVEVARGPGSVAYGSDAFGGVIHARTRRAAPGSGTSGRLSAGLGAGQPQQRASLELSHGYGTGGVTLQGHYRSFDDYQSPEGEVLNSGSELFGGRGRWDQFLGAGVVSVAWQSDFGRDIERPRSNSADVRFFYPTEDSHRVVAAWETAGVGGFNRLHASAFLGSYSIVTDQDRFATPSEPRAVERADVRARDFHLRGHAERPLGEARFEVGVDVNGRFDLQALDVNELYDSAGDLAQTDVNVSVDDARRVDAGLYTMLELEAARGVSLSGGLRADRVTTRNRGGYFGDRSTDSVAVSGFASAALRAASGLEVTAQAARGFRDPVLSDRYFRGPTGRGYITGSPDLDSETSLQLDAALRYTGRGWRLAGYAYQYRIDDLIERFEDEPDFFFFRNRGRARLRGFEVEGQVQLGGGFFAELAGTLLQGDALDDGEPLADIPPKSASLRLGRDWERGYVQLRGAVFGSDARQGSGEVDRESYGLVDLFAGLELGAALQLGLSVRNLLDAAYYTSPNRRATLAPGRSLLVSATLRF